MSTSKSFERLNSRPRHLSFSLAVPFSSSSFVHLSLSLSLSFPRLPDLCALHSLRFDRDNLRVCFFHTSGSPLNALG